MKAAAQDAMADVGKKKRSLAPYATTLAIFVLLALLLGRGLDFYNVPVEDRSLHPDFRILSPTGFIGQGYGVVATLLMIANLLYLLRRKFAGLPAGSMQLWLNIHVFTGLACAVFVAFHSSFQLRQTIHWLMVTSLALITLTGLIGRYLYALTPSIDRTSLKRNVQQLEELMDGLGREVESILGEHKVIRPKPTLLRTLLTIPRWMEQARDRKREIRTTIRTRTMVFDAEHRVALEGVVDETAKLAAEEVRSVAARHLLLTWRGLHRLFAILVVLAVTVHIYNAWVSGYRWIFSE